MSSSEPNASKRLLMVHPESFDVINEYNPYMDAEVEVDTDLAQDQWEEMVSTYKALGIEVMTVKTGKENEDEVFTANHGVAYQEDDETKVLLAKMDEPERKAEIPEIKKALEEKGIPTDGPTEAVFEGSGEAMEHPNENTFWLGYGQRTEKAAAEEIENITGYTVETLELVDPDFYHLDTCFEHLTDNTALIYPSAITDTGKIEKEYDTLIEIPEEEARNGMAGNAYCPEGENVIINTGNPETCQTLRNHGFNPIPVNTSEYVKSGGSIYCTKLELDG